MVHRARTLGMLRLLRGIGRLPPPKKRIGRLPHPQLPDAIGRSYTRALASNVCDPARAAFAEVADEILSLLCDHRAELHLDADVGIGIAAKQGEKRGVKERASVAAELASASWRGRKAAELIDRAARVFRKKLHPAQLESLIKQFGGRTDLHSRQQLDAQLRAAIGVPFSAIERPMQDKLGEWTARNLALVATVPDRYFDRIQQDVQEAFVGGTRPETLRDQFVERYGMSENDAEGIARDQVLKLSADLNHARMESLGVERAIWRTMNDNRVCDECFDKDGEEFDLSEGLGGCLPGECHPEDRCYSEPILDDLIGP